MIDRLESIPVPAVAAFHPRTETAIVVFTLIRDGITLFTADGKALLSPSRFSWRSILPAYYCQMRGPAMIVHLLAQ